MKSMRSRVAAYALAHKDTVRDFLLNCTKPNPDPVLGPDAQCEVALAELHKNNLTQANVEYLGVQLTGLHAELDALQRALANEHRRKPTEVV